MITVDLLFCNIFAVIFKVIFKTFVSLSDIPVKPKCWYKGILSDFSCISLCARWQRRYLNSENKTPLCDPNTCDKLKGLRLRFYLIKTWISTLTNGLILLPADLLGTVALLIPGLQDIRGMLSSWLPSLLNMVVNRRSFINYTIITSSCSIMLPNAP